jgi:hypothetical protein
LSPATKRSAGAALLGTLRPALAALVLAALPGAALAQEMPVFRIEMKDGTISPTRIEAPANTPFKFEISNTGQAPVEFESLELKREKVLAPGATSSIVFRRVEPGEYDFFDDFHPEARAKLVVK